MDKKKIFIVMAGVLFSLCSVLSGLATGFLMLLGARLLMGATEGAVMPISHSLVAEEVSQTGKPVRLATEFDVPGSIDNIDFFAGAARHLEGKATAEYSADHTSSIRREAIEQIKKLQKEGLSEDLTKDAEKQMQDLTDRHIALVEKHLATKEKEIMSV